MLLKNIKPTQKESPMNPKTTIKASPLTDGKSKESTLDQFSLSGWSAEEAQIIQQAALEAAYQREREVWTPEVNHE